MKKNLGVIFMALFLICGLYAALFGITSIVVTHLLMPIVAYLGLPALTYKLVMNLLLLLLVFVVFIKMIK